jgi:membrane-associated PAP2 superfamily phosphatase
LNKDTGKIILHTVILLALTIPFWVFGLDMKAERALYTASKGVFTWVDNPFFTALYKYGTIPALMLSLTAIIVFALGFVYRGLKNHRKAALLVMFTMLLGPGLIINVISKNYAGRPRPREVREFGGSWDFRQPLEFGKPGRGFSFPCGHCSTGFVFYTLYLIYRKKNRTAAGAALSGAVVFGGLLGLARMAQGAHFASDVLWAGGITMLTAEILHYKIIRTDEDENFFDRISVKNRAVVFCAGAVLLACMAVFFLFATPFSRTRWFGFSPAGSYSLNVDVGGGDIFFQDTDGAAGIRAEARGFGLPASNYDDSLTSRDGSAAYKAVIRGMFTELNATVRVSMAAARGCTLTAADLNGSIHYVSGRDLSSVSFHTGSGDIVFSPSGGSCGSVDLAAEKGDILIILPKDYKLTAGSIINAGTKSGEIRFVNKSSYFGGLMGQAAGINGSKKVFLTPTVKGGIAVNLSAKKITLER